MIGWDLSLALDPNHELFGLAERIPWDDLTKEFGRLYVPDLGRPGIPIRLMAGLHLLKHTYGLSDEGVVKGWVENPYWQHFCGEVMFQHHFPTHKGTLILSELILTQKRKTKGKVYSLHAPEVECIAKGKAHRPYEFGVKASLAVTHKEGFVVGAMSCPGNPFDGHTLEVSSDTKFDPLNDTNIDPLG